MERRKAITVAALISSALLVGALAVTANAGILGAPNNDKVGQLTPVDATTLATTSPIHDPAAVSPTTATPPPARTAVPPAASHHDDDGRDGDHGGVERDD